MSDWTRSAAACAMAAKKLHLPVAHLEAADGQQGMVVVLAAIGMQTPRWDGVPPAMLYRIVGALRAVGLEGEARMIAAEALARA